MIGLKTAKGTKQLKLDPSVYESLQKEKVEPGDVIYIESNTGMHETTGKTIDQIRQKVKSRDQNIDQNTEIK